MRDQDDASLVAGELVTSSISRTRRPVRFEVRAKADEVTLRVWDTGLMRPGRLDGVAFPAGAARCWDLVRRFASRDGHDDGGQGRQVWASIRTMAPAADGPVAP
jgi:hypothetical protein